MLKRVTANCAIRQVEVAVPNARARKRNRGRLKDTHKHTPSLRAGPQYRPKNSVAGLGKSFQCRGTAVRFFHIVYEPFIPLSLLGAACVQTRPTKDLLWGKTREFVDLHSHSKFAKDPLANVILPTLKQRNPHILRLGNAVQTSL